jgi:hypothetical protein
MSTDGPSRRAESLFSDGPKVSIRQIPYSASAYERLNSRDGEPARRVREMMDRWWLALPPAARPQVRVRFLESAPAVHLGGFFELYMHEVLGRECLGVEADIGNDDDPLHRPDFRALCADSGFSVEATAVLGDDAVDPKDRARVDRFYDLLNEKLRNRDFLLHIKVRIAGPDTPGATVATQVDRWLDPLDPDAELARRAAGGQPSQHCLEYRGWVVDLEASPLKPDLRARSDLRVIGSRTEGFEVASVEHPELDTLKEMDEVGPLLRSLKKKAGHGYDLRDEPFVIALLCAGLFAEDLEVEMALMGGPGDDGLWVKSGRPRYSRVSAVLTAADLRPETAALVEPTLWINPWASQPLAADQLPWRRIEFPNGGRAIGIPAVRTTAEILGVGGAWPYE